MRRVAVGIQFRRQGEVWFIAFAGANIFQTEQDFAIGSRILAKLIRWESKNLKSAPSKLRLQLVQAPKVVREPSVGGGVDDEEDLSTIIGEWNHPLSVIQILVFVVKDGGRIIVIWMTKDFFVSFVNASGGRQNRRKEEKSEQKTVVETQP